MSIGRRFSRSIEPVRYPESLDEFRGKWVALKDGRVVAVGESSRDLAWRLRDRGIEGATARFVTEPTDGIRVGLG